MGELKVCVGVHDLSSPALSTKHFVDASSTMGGRLTVKLVTETGVEIMFEGKPVYISERGNDLIKSWRMNDRTPDGPGIAVAKDNWLGDKFWSRKEEDV
jgi:hypothetical protein